MVVDVEHPRRNPGATALKNPSTANPAKAASAARMKTGRTSAGTCRACGRRLTAPVAAHRLRDRPHERRGRHEQRQVDPEHGPQRRAGELGEHSREQGPHASRPC